MNRITRTITTLLLLTIPTSAPIRAAVHLEARVTIAAPRITTTITAEITGGLPDRRSPERNTGVCRPQHCGWSGRGSKWRKSAKGATLGVTREKEKLTQKGPQHFEQSLPASTGFIKFSFFADFLVLSSV